MSTDSVVVATNPFATLQVSTRDHATRIMEAADERSLTIDEKLCQQARATLINPRRRLDAEIGWFPGVAPGVALRAAAASSIVHALEMPLSGLAMANGLSIGARASQPSGVEGLRMFLEGMVKAVDETRAGQLQREINEDRAISGFPTVSSGETVEQVLQERFSALRMELLDVFDRAPTAQMAEAMHRSIEPLAAAGRFPDFLHDIVDDYALRARPFMTMQTESVERLAAKARVVAGHSPHALVPLIEAIGEIIETWEELTYPIQKSATARGQTDEESERLAFVVRSLSIDLFNQHDLIDESRRLSEMVAASFSTLPRVADKIAEDSAALENIAEKARLKEAEIAYAADVGLVMKSRLAIDGSGLEWKGRRTLLATVRSARWGGISRSVNGVPTGTDYLIAWSDGRETTTVNLRNKAVNEAFTARLWRALADQITSSIVTQLKQGEELRFGTALVKDATVVLRRKKFLGDEPAEYAWGDVTINSIAGSFVINGPSKSKASVSMSYREVENVHFLEAIIRVAFKNGCVNLGMTFS